MSLEGLGGQEVDARFADIVEPYRAEYGQSALLISRVLKAYKSLHAAAHKASFAAHGDGEILSIHRHEYDFGRYADRAGRTHNGAFFIESPNTGSDESLRLEANLAHKNDHPDSLASLVVMAATLEDDLEAFQQHHAHLHIAQ